MGRPSKYAPEVRERAIRMVREHGAEHPSQWVAIASIASKLGCTTETLRRWVRQAERDAGQRPGVTTDERQRLKELERENHELKRANEILRKASAYFARSSTGGRSDGGIRGRPTATILRLAISFTTSRTTSRS
jgi:transposase